MQERCVTLPELPAMDALNHQVDCQVAQLGLVNSSSVDFNTTKVAPQISHPVSKVQQRI